MFLTTVRRRKTVLVLSVSSRQVLFSSVKDSFLELVPGHFFVPGMTTGFSDPNLTFDLVLGWFRDIGLEMDLTTLLVWLSKNRSIRHLSLGKNFNNIKSKSVPVPKVVFRTV